MKNKKAKQMIEPITGAKYSHLYTPDYKIDKDSRYTLRFCGSPLGEIKVIDPWLVYWDKQGNLMQFKNARDVTPGF